MINRESIIINSESSSATEVLIEMINNSYEQGLIRDKKQFYEAVLKREEESETAIGYSIAIPHGKSEVVSEPFVIYLRTQNDLTWNKSNKEVRHIFMMGLPESGGERLHLKFLAEMSKKLMNEEFRDRLNKSEDQNQTFFLLNEINESIKKGG